MFHCYTESVKDDAISVNSVFVPGVKHALGRIIAPLSHINRYRTARSCHLSVLCMNQTEELATKRVFGVITLLITDYLIFLQF